MLCGKISLRKTKQAVKIYLTVREFCGIIFLSAAMRIFILARQEQTKKRPRGWLPGENRAEHFRVLPPEEMMGE